MRKQQGAAQHRRRTLRLAVGTPLALIAAGVLAYGAVFGTFGDDAEPKAAAAPAPVPDNAMAAVAAMQPGWNLGNSLDAIPNETNWGQPRTTETLLDSVRAQGFKSIRIPVTWSDHQGAAPDYTIDQAYMDRVEEVVDWAIADGFYVILDVHHDSWQWAGKMSTDRDKVLARFNATWTQIAAQFRDKPAQLVFESINEPQFDNADQARKAEMLNELNTSFHKVVRASGGRNKNRLLMLPTEVCTPDQRLMNNLATTIKSLRDPRLIATVHYYGYFPFSVNLAGSTRFDAQARGDLDKTFKRMRDTFVAQGIPVVLGEYGLLGYDHGPGAVERGEMLKYFEALGDAARTNKVTTVLWDNGSFYDRGKMKWKDAGLFRQIKSSWTTRSATASSDRVFVPKSGPVKDRSLTLNLNGATSTALKQGTSKLVSGKDYTVTLAIDYYREGGYDRETWNRICDGLAHEAMNLMMALSAPAHSYLARECERAVREAAGITPREGGMREAIQQQVAKGLLMSVLTVGRQTLVEPEEWPDELPAAVLGAVRSSKRIKADPTMANLRD